MDTPQTRDSLRINQLEDAALTVDPADAARAVIRVLQQLKQELPEIRAISTSLRLWHPTARRHPCCTQPTEIQSQRNIICKQTSNWFLVSQFICYNLPHHSTSTSLTSVSFSSTCLSVLHNTAKTSTSTNTINKMQNYRVPKKGETSM